MNNTMTIQVAVIKKLICIITILLIQNAVAQQLTETQKLATTARIWGFLKYYHPQVAAGKYEWDQELAGILPKVKEAKSKEELSSIYLKWIEELGNVPVCKKCPKQQKDWFDKNFNLSWMEDATVFTPELTARLRYIEANRLLGEKHYVSPDGKGGSLGITNEPSYNDFTYPDEKGRLVTLFRMWNAVEYFFPHKYLTDVKWDKVLEQAIPKVAHAKSADEYQLALMQAMAHINDSHGDLHTPMTASLYGSYRTPFYGSIVEDKLIVTDILNDSLCAIDNIKIGDIINLEGKKSPIDKLNANSRYYHYSNEAVRKRFANYILWGDTPTATITFERNGREQEKQISRYKREDIKHKPKAGAGYKMLDGNIGYANLSIVQPKDIDAMMDAFDKCPSVIFDLRIYPQWIVHELSGRLTPENKEFAQYLRADLNYPGRFVWSESLSIKSRGKKAYKGKVVVIVNEGTQSRGEFTAMAIQAVADAVVIGSQTAGADGEIIYVGLPGDFNARFTGNGVFYPDKSETQRIGIVPDIEIHPTIAGIQAGRDELLEKAIETAKR